MITDTLRQILLDRLDTIERNIRYCNNGAEIHEVGNMRNVITLLRELVHTNDCEENTAKCMLECLEKRQIEFFKKKFYHLK